MEEGEGKLHINDSDHSIVKSLMIFEYSEKVLSKNKNKQS